MPRPGGLQSGPQAVPVNSTARKLYLDKNVISPKTTSTPGPGLIMLGDTPYDIEASSKAAVLIVASRSGGWSDEALRRAAAIYDSPQHLLAEHERSPFHAG